LSEARQNVKMRGSTLFKILSSAAQTQLLWPAEGTPSQVPRVPSVLFTPAQINIAPLCFAGTKSLPLWCFNHSLLAVHCYYAYDLLEPKHNGTCTVYPSLDGSDDVPAIIDAFRFCGKNGTINFLNETYSIQSVMNTTGLENCVIDLKGTLLVRSFSTQNVHWLINVVEHRHRLLARKFYARGISKPVNGMDFGRTQYYFPWPRIRHTKWQRSSVV
jgi:hypothetical protein